MKGTILILILPLVLLIHFCSCQKEINPLEPARTTNNDSTLLSLFVELDTLHTPGLDTSRKISLSYDNRKRLATCDYFYYDTLRGLPEWSAHYQISYNGSDSFPDAVRLIGVNYDPSGSNQQFQINASFFYNSNNKLERFVWTDNQFPDSTVSHYTYSGATVTRKTFLYIAGSYNIYDSTVFIPEFINGKVINATHTSHSINLVDNYTTIYKFDYNNNGFDTKPNPLKILEPVRDVMVEIGAQDGNFCGDANGGFGFYISDNNVTRYTESYYYNGIHRYTNQYTATYTYNSAGLPVQSIFNRTEYGFRYLAGKKLYFYTK